MNTSETQQTTAHEQTDPSLVFIDPAEPPNNAREAECHKGSAEPFTGHHK